MRVLVMTAVAPERDAVQRGLGHDSRFEFALAGVGLAAAAVNGAIELAKAEYDLVIIAGIAGGFVGKAEIGSLVVASEIIGADLGVELLDGFSSLDELGFGSTRVGVAADVAERVTAALLAAGLQAQMAPVLTVATATGTAATAAALAARVPGAAAEAMEGFGIATAAQQRGVPVLEIRAISNAIGPRDRDAWRIGDAFKALEAASSVLAEVL
ncbi:futalosine hydrolase [Paenibacillus alginolyticus]|uniref:futalosine hydrolase n=1 Tax=Paenibacillus alginolyticus TaxID=59839 RepID=UPI00042030DA|nr:MULTISPECIES: futalosine hydrolase [Paenibacillus]MCY9663851.1 futalosine hydrolase [Paenibacillus alginolyticus]NRF90476.1 futalosine hydrolase [Paenibacillus frigoriresistens]